MKTRIPFLLPLVCAATAALLSLAPAAQAGYIVTLTQQGSNVVATGSGAIDLTGLTFDFQAGQDSRMQPNAGRIATGALNPLILEAVVDLYSGVSGPTSFGSGGITVADNSGAGSGDMVGIDGTGTPPFGAFLEVPQGYISGTALSDSATYSGATFASLGVTPGTYEWTWGTGADQNFTLKIGTATVPDHGSALGLLFLSLLALLGATSLRHFRLA
jgi:hypothetical protein